MEHLKELELMKHIRWRSPENTKPRTSRWHRNHEAMAYWYHRWWIELTIVGPPPEEPYFIDSMFKTIPVEKLIFREPIINIENSSLIR